MSRIARYLPVAVQRLRMRDPTLEWINLWNQQFTDVQLIELIECLLDNSNVITGMSIDHNKLTDETGIKLAQYLTVSTTIEMLILSNNQFSETTYLALASALRINTSLKALYLHGNQMVDQNRVNTAFTDALILNPNRSTSSSWHLYSWPQNKFRRLKDEAEKLGHLSLQALLLLVL